MKTENFPLTSEQVSKQIDKAYADLDQFRREFKQKKPGETDGTMLANCLAQSSGILQAMLFNQTDMITQLAAEVDYLRTELEMLKLKITQ